MKSEAKEFLLTPRCLSSQLRARYTIRIPDAIQMAVGQLYGAEAFLTNDAGLKNAKDIRVLVLDDFLAS